MPMATSDFVKFIGELGLRKEIAQLLWDADIHSPQELASKDASEIREVTSDSLLVNCIHPVLQKQLFSITTAKDPYKKAISVMKKHAKSMADSDDDDEPMITSSGVGLSSDSTQSDAAPFSNKTKEPDAHIRGSRVPDNNSASYNNSGTRMVTSGRGGVVQSHIGIKNGMPEQISISGGNFVQSNILSSGPVTYNNTNTVISTSMDQNSREDVQKRRNTFLDSSLFIDGTMVETSALGWTDRQEFWVDNINLPQTQFESFSHRFADETIYKVKNHGQSRALILNNINFRAGNSMTARTGADIDCSRMEILLKDLGFIVRRENDKSAKEMLELLQEFAKSRENMRADMTAVYIGSHGERDEQGNDTFVGIDGERVKFNDVKEIFSPENCPLLVGLPKIFFLQFCRQERRPSGPLNIAHAVPLQTARVMSDAAPTENISSDAGAFVETNEETRAMDMLCVYATLAGTKAYRDTEDGSWFVTALLRVLEKHVHKDDLLSMLTQVNNMVSVNEGQEGTQKAVQVSEVVHNLRRKIYFYPKLEV